MIKRLEVGDSWGFTLPGINREIPKGTILEVTSVDTLQHEATKERKSCFVARVKSVPEQKSSKPITIRVPKGTEVYIIEE